MSRASYDNELQFISTTFGAQYQQVNLTSDSVWSHTCSFRNGISNLLAWRKDFINLSVLSKELFIYKVQWIYIYHLIGLAPLS